ncbi:MAG: hypothetical protein JW863_09555 [Chitinispirillaceae bacterium]|nr:hypothetical protein [Chitinispirillaceae bacterium]
MIPRLIIKLAFIVPVIFISRSFSQCNPVDAITTASFSITGGEACSTYANLRWTYRRNNGTMTIEWGTSTSYGTSKSVYAANPINIPNLTPNTEYFYHVYGIWQGRTYEYSKTSFTTAAAGPANRAPEITSTASVACTTGQTHTYTVTATDPDNDEVTFSAGTMPNWITFANPVLTLKPVTGSNLVTVRIIASDGKGGTDTLNLSVTVTNSTAVMKNAYRNSPTFTLHTGGSHLAFIPSGNSPVTISLHTLKGSTVLQHSVEPGTSSFTLPAGMASGVYLLRLSDTVHSRLYPLNIRN